MLHLISRATVDDVFLTRIAPDDAIVLMDDAVFRAVKSSQAAQVLQQLPSSVSCYALTDQLACRGLLAEELIASLQIIDYPALVELTVAHTPIYTWS